MAATINGIPVNFGFEGTKDSENGQGISITGVTGTLIQSAEQSKVADIERAKDGNGNEVVHAWSNLHDEASLEWIVSGSTLATAKANTTNALKTPGSIVNITGCTSMPSLINSTWEVQSGVKVAKSNTTLARVTFPIHLFSGITAVAS